LQTYLGDGYHCLSDCHLWQIRLVIFVNKSHLPAIHNIESSTEATGIARVMGNKGGVVISFSYYDLSLCFVNTHLAAHQDKTERRNADVAEVISGVKVGHKGKMDVVNQFHHLFWMGDLNYRLDYGSQGDKHKPSEEQHAEMVDLIKEKKLSTLFATDQLAKSMADKKVFIGFKEGDCSTFAPTFSCERNVVELGYQKKRSPAWCDRILWRSFAGYDAKLKKFDSAPKVTSSDHKPVFAMFDLLAFQLNAGVDHTKGAAQLIFSKLKGSNLPGLDVGGFSDPYIKFSAHIVQGNSVQTPVIKKTVNPEWTEKQVPTIPLSINSPVRISRSHVYVRVFDHDTTSKDDLIGSAVLNLGDFLSGATTKFTLQLTKSGLPTGELHGEARLAWAAPTFKAD